MNKEPLFHDIDNRVEIDKEDSDSAYFNSLMSKLEYMIKIVTSGVLACLGDDVDRHRYSVEHRIIRADSLGDWVQALNDLLVGPAAQFFYQEGKEVVKNLTERVGSGDWRHSAVSALKDAAMEIGAEYPLGTKVSLRQFFEIGAQLRNRSRGHGAPTTKQFAQSCPSFAYALQSVEKNLLLFKLPWAYLHQNLSGKYRVSPLLGDPSCFNFLKSSNDTRLPSGVYLYLERPVGLTLVFSDPELNDIALPNGNFHNSTFEILSYATNDVDELRLIGVEKEKGRP